MRKMESEGGSENEGLNERGNELMDGQMDGNCLNE